MTPEQINHMVNRFLAWKLPEHFKPDNGVAFTPPEVRHPDLLPQNRAAHWPSGTNLLDYGQATEMVRHMVEGLPEARG